jgi:NhaA family Na+:H+ antiporter
LLRRLAPVSAFVAVPLFALTNAGVGLSAESVTSAATDRVTWAVLAGLLLGKFLGITGAIALATRTGLGHLPAAVTGRHIAGLGLLGALGFTVALFITELAYTDPALIDHAKISILAASLIAAATAAIVLATKPAGQQSAMHSSRTATTSASKSTT